MRPLETIPVLFLFAVSNQKRGPDIKSESFLGPRTDTWEGFIPFLCLSPFFKVLGLLSLFTAALFPFMSHYNSLVPFVCSPTSTHICRVHSRSIKLTNPGNTAPFQSRGLSASAAVRSGRINSIYEQHTLLPQQKGFTEHKLNSGKTGKATDQREDRRVSKGSISVWVQCTENENTSLINSIVQRKCETL